jgi:hypothetical protein
LRGNDPDRPEAISEPSVPGFLPQAALPLERGALAMTSNPYRPEAIYSLKRSTNSMISPKDFSASMSIIISWPLFWNHTISRIFELTFS